MTFNPFERRAGELMGFHGEVPPFTRGSKDYECPACGKLAWAHKHCHFGPEGNQLLLLKMCDGTYLKP